MINIIGLVWTILALVGQPSGRTGPGPSIAAEARYQCSFREDRIEALFKETEKAEPDPWLQPFFYELAVAGLGVCRSFMVEVQAGIGARSRTFFRLTLKA